MVLRRKFCDSSTVVLDEIDGILEIARCCRHLVMYFTDGSESRTLGAVTTVEEMGPEKVMYVKITLCVMEARALFAMSEKKGVLNRAMIRNQTRELDGNNANSRVTRGLSDLPASLLQSLQQFWTAYKN